MSANIASVDEESPRKDIKNLVRKTVEETFNALLDEEASELVGAERYERAAGRETYRSGHHARRLITGVGEIELSGPKLRGTAARTVRDGFIERLACTEFPSEHWHRIRTNNGIERINREIRRRTRAVGTFPDGNSVLMLVTAKLKHIVEHERGKRRYLDMSKLEEMDELKEKAEGQKRTGPRTAKSICERNLRYLLVIKHPAAVVGSNLHTHYDGDIVIPTTQILMSCMEDRN